MPSKEYKRIRNKLFKSKTPTREELYNLSKSQLVDMILTVNK